MKASFGRYILHILEKFCNYERHTVEHNLSETGSLYSSKQFIIRPLLFQSSTTVSLFDPSIGSTPKEKRKILHMLSQFLEVKSVHRWDVYDKNVCGNRKWKGFIDHLFNMTFLNRNYPLLSITALIRGWL